MPEVSVPRRSPSRPHSPFWSVPAEDLLQDLWTAGAGLASAEAAARLRRLGPNTLGERKRSDAPALLLRQFTSPIILILIAAAVLSLAVRDPVDSAIILGIVLVGGVLGFCQERGAATAVEKLLATVSPRATLCSDKTGTLTEGRVQLHASLEGEGRPSERVLFHAFLNATYQTAFHNPIDDALRIHRSFDLEGWSKSGRGSLRLPAQAPGRAGRPRGAGLPGDQGRAARRPGVCSGAEGADGTRLPMERARAEIEGRHRELSAAGFSTLGVAVRPMESAGPVDPPPSGR